MSRMDEIIAMKVDRTKFAVLSFEESAQEERDYWMTCTPEERLTALEMMRRTAYGYDEGEQGLQRFFEVVERQKR